MMKGRKIFMIAVLVNKEYLEIKQNMRMINRVKMNKFIGN